MALPKRKPSLRDKHAALLTPPKKKPVRKAKAKVATTKVIKNKK